MSRPTRRRALTLASALTFAEAVLVAWRRGFLIGANTIVRCRAGHLFTTLWIPGLSVKALRLGYWRLQRCPVGNHWTVVTPVRAADLTRKQQQQATAEHDLRIP